MEQDGLSAQRKALDPGDSHSYLAYHLLPIIDASLQAIPKEDRLAKQILLCNRIIQLLQDELVEPAWSDRTIMQPGEMLLSIGKRNILGELPKPERPSTPLGLCSLLTGTSGDPQMVSELQKEIATADRIDILCAFVKWTGIRLLGDALKQFTNRPGTQLRIITTSYTGVTDAKAVAFLASLNNAELKVSYDTLRTRLHAKAYAFHRNSGFGTVYVGSSNMSYAALTEGLEWNIKLSERQQGHLWGKIVGTFETYWQDRDFVTYKPEDYKKLTEALQVQRGGGMHDATSMLFFDLKPYEFQKEILEKMQAEREIEGRRKHLIVAATGTGKTMIAAFDYRDWVNTLRRQELNVRARILFIAHREEILKQSRDAFRMVLRDRNFGELMVGGKRPDVFDHLFMSIQTYNSQRIASTTAPDYFDYVVVDEFHHAAAPSYQELLNHVKPKVLLGLTATPERTDKLDVLRFFDDHITAEIRLPDAINRKLLSPFQYFGIADPVDLSHLTWQRGAYVKEDLERQYLASDERTKVILQKLHEIVLDPKSSRGLGFCVSQVHAKYMAEKFNAAGIPSINLDANSPDEIRNEAVRRLQDRQINFIFVVDLYNEGVDIPEADTVLFLRPTESLTVFLQQLGRGLRLSEGKDCLTVLDFVGHAHQKYRFDHKFRALIGNGHARIEKEIQEGFPHLPSGCSIQMEKMAKEYVLENIRQAIHAGRARLVEEIRVFEEEANRPLNLGNFIEHQGLSLDDIYRRDSWTSLCADAGRHEPVQDPDRNRAFKGLRRIEHINDPHYIRRLQALLSTSAADFDKVIGDPLNYRAFLMLHLSLWEDSYRPGSLSESYQRIQKNPALLEELRYLLELKLGLIPSIAPPVELPIASELHLHALYTRNEILAALGYWTLEARPDVREGRLLIESLKTELFFVTLNKTEQDYSPTTLYEDYAISDQLFHWQSQSTTSDQSATGQRYISDRTYTFLLFVRENKAENVIASAYYFLGPAQYVSHSGSRPISIIWKLQHPMPAHLLRKTRRLAVGE